MIAKLIVSSLVIVAVASTEWPAGVSPAECPNYPYCTPVAPVGVPLYTAPIARFTSVPLPYYRTYDAPAVPLAGGVAAARFPAGMDPALCPNYPYCGPVMLKSSPIVIAKDDGQYHGEGLAESMDPEHPY